MKLVTFVILIAVLSACSDKEAFISESKPSISAPQNTNAVSTPAISSAPVEITFVSGIESALQVASIQAKNAPIYPSDWVSMGGVPGLDGKVNNIVVHGENVYVAGIFSSINTDGMKDEEYGNGLTTVAMWNGTSWNALASYGGCGDVQTLAVDNEGNLYAGGTYCINKVPVNNVGKWDGKEWKALGEGINGEVRALAFDKKGTLYATGGSYRGAKSDGDIVGGFVMKWDGKTWSKLGEGVLIGSGESGRGNTLAIDGRGHVFVGGSFEKVAKVKAHNIAEWDGKKWTPLGRGVGGVLKSDEENYDQTSAYSISFNSNNAPYVASSRGVEKWNGKKWEQLNIKTSAIVGTLLIDDQDHIYVGLISTCNVEGGPSDGTEQPIQYWNGIKWGPFSFTGSNSGASPGCANGGSVNVFAKDILGNLYVGGAFAATESGARNIAKWNGKKWETLGENMGVNDMVYDLAVDNAENLYVRGAFTRVDNIAVAKNQVAKWDGQKWSVFKAADKPIRRMTTDTQGGLYIATGTITGKYNETGSSDISKWDGNSWKKISNIDYLINRFAVDGKGRIYTCGHTGDENDHYGVLNYHGIDMWDGKAWTRLPENTLKADYQCDLKLDKENNLYVTTVNGDWKWDGTNWKTEINALIVKAFAIGLNEDYYIIERENYNEGRSLMDAGNTINGSVYHLGATSLGTISTMAASKHYLYIGGSFTWVDRKIKPFLARRTIESKKD